MKKRSSVLILLLCFTLFLSLASCGKETAGETAGPEETTAPEETHEPEKTTGTPETTSPSSYSVTFSVDGNETTLTVGAGETPVYSGITSWETAEHFYKITGWEPEIAPANADVTYTAVIGEYGLTLYDVKFMMPGGLVTVPTHENELPTPPEGYETDLTKLEKIGTFVRWNKELVAPTAENMADGAVMIYTPFYTYTKRYFAVVTAAKNGAKGILTMTYDDGNYDTAVWVNQKNKVYGLRGSCMLIAGRSSFVDAVDRWKAIFADGTLEPQCHSMSHTKDTIEGTRALYRTELVESKRKIESALSIPGQVICFASPYCQLRDFSYKTDESGKVVYQNGNPVTVSDGGSKKMARQNYFAVRNGPEGLNTLDPPCTEDAGGWYNVYVQWFYHNDSQTDAIRKGWIDGAVKNQGWLIILAHGIVDSSDSVYNLTKTEAEPFFRHASTYIQSGELWAATFGEATKYLREKQGTTVAARYEDGRLFVDMTINRTTEDGKFLSENVFNYPLTVEVRVPDDWHKVTYQDGENVKTAEIYTRDGMSCAMLDLTPGADGVTVTTELTDIK